eukprot:1160200-Pelagomonas_calceolata.AAC.11
MGGASHFDVRIPPFKGMLTHKAHSEGGIVSFEDFKTVKTVEILNTVSPQQKRTSWLEYPLTPL